jgi:hypothetical protein
MSSNNFRLVFFKSYRRSVYDTLNTNISSVIYWTPFLSQKFASRHIGTTEDRELGSGVFRTTDQTNSAGSWHPHTAATIKTPTSDNQMQCGSISNFKDFKIKNSNAFTCGILRWQCNSFSKSNTPVGPPLWSSGQSSWLQIQRSRVRFSAQPDFLRSSGSGTGSTQPREDNLGATWMERQRLRLENRN